MKTVPRGMLAAFAVMVLVLVIGGLFLFHTQKQQLRGQVATRLESVAQLKVDQIVQWRQQRLADAQTVMENAFVSAAIAQWLATPTPAAADQLLSWFRSLQKHYQYADILLADADGQVRLSLSGVSGSIAAAVLPTLDEAKRERRPVFSELHRLELGDAPHLDTVVPLLVEMGEERRVVGSLVLRSDASSFLYPMLQSWPGQSESAETLLVRRDGEHVFFLNELRHRKNTALQFRLPLSRTQVPAVMAVKGVRGVVAGTDYRGVEVLSVLSSVPGSAWLMVTKIDTIEAFAQWRTQAQLIAGLLIGLGLALAAGFGMAWQHYVKKQYQAAYRAESRYRATLMSVGDGVIACDSGGRVTLLNPVAEMLTGWPEQEALGKPVEEVFVIVNEATRLPVANPVARVLREGIVVGLANHTSLIKKDGTEYPIADSGAPIFDDQRRIAGAVLVFRDQTQDRRAEAALLRSNQQLVRAEEMAEMGCWEFDFQSQTVWASPSARRIYGLSDEVWTIEAVQALPLPEYRQALNQALEGLVRRGEAYDVEFRISRPTDGAVIDIRSQAEYHPEVGKVFGVIQDITEQKRAEAAIRESESRYRSLFQNNHAVMLLLNPSDGSVVDANPAAEAYYGWKRKELLTKNIADINMLPPQELQTAMTAALSARRKSFEFRHRLADGSVREVEVVAGPIQVAGQERLYSIIHDITERKRAEEQKEQLQEQLLQAQKLELVGRLAGGVAHDLNNLLSPILGYGDVLLMELPAANQHRKYVQYIVQAGLRARDLVRQLLAFGRKQTLVVETVDLNEVISVFAKLLRRTVREDIAIEMVLAPALPAVRVDTGQMEQVIMNLVVNAQDAMPEGGKITIETAAAELDGRDGEPSGRVIVLTISDTGSGMDAAVCEQIFAPFFTTKERDKGTGLGLSTAYGIVKQHGGNIGVESVPGEGTTFRITLPAVEANPDLKPLEAADAPEKAEGGETVMVVEDNTMVRQLTVDILTRQGYTVLEAAGGAECLRLLGEHPLPIDLLITDVVMPEMNGKMLYREVAHLVPGLKVLYMSGYTENIIASRGVLDGGVDFIQKPFTPNALAAKVRELLTS